MHEDYFISQLIKNHLIIDDVDLTNMTTDERAKAGLFLALQNPAENDRS